jgi:NAD(P)-dependent dehydrogenase (short-subunit alcohol dehydrogenase family)
MPEPKRIVITGVSRGLGRAMVERFIVLGHRVCGCSRRSQSVLQLAERYPAPHDFQTVDVAEHSQVGRWARHVLQTVGPPDLLLNNAGLINESAVLWKIAADEFSDVVDVNIKGTFHVLRQFLPAMIERGSGVIVNFSSGWGRSAAARVAPYCASKWAVEGLTGALAEELPSGLAAVTLNPGMVHTEMLESCLGTDATRYPSPVQWASRAVPFLLELSREHNGQQLSVL